MHATVICPGPSLATVWVPRRHELPALIAVNRAIEFGADWFVAGDQSTFERWPRRPRVGLCAPANVVRRAIAGDYGHLAATALAGVAIIPWDDLPFVSNGPAIECNYSAIAACALARYLGATIVNLYGADMAGSADWDGTDETPNRNPDRWAREMIDLQRLAAAGGAIIRHLADGSHPVINSTSANQATPHAG